MKKLFIIGIAALLLVAFSVPAMAKVKIGGIIFTDFYYLDRDKDNSQWMGVGNDPYQVTTIQVPNITRLNARWTNEDNVGMFIELGLGQGGAVGGGIENSSSSGAVLRHAYGWWDITPDFQLLAGKSTTPFSPLNPSQLLGTRSGTLNIIGVGYGNFYSGRFAQVRGTWKFGKMGRLAVALVDPNGSARIVNTFAKYYPWDWTAGSANPWEYQTNTKLPRIDIAVPLYFGPVSLYPGFLWQQRTVDNISAAGVVPGAADDSLDTYIGSLGVKGGFGGFSFAAEGNYGQNWGNTRGLIGTSSAAMFSAATLNADGSTNNTTTYGYWFDLGYRFGPVNPHVIFSQMKSQATLANNDIDTSSTVWGFSIPIDLAKGFRIRPELMWYDDGEFQLQGTDEVSLGSYAIYGVQFQITF
jgi:hypothetical protein